MRISVLIAALLAVSGCDQPEATRNQTTETSTMTEVKAEANSLSAILAAQPETVKARYIYRNPEETLNFFGVDPSMSVVEALPGGGWYSKLLLAHLGSEGQLIGANYPHALWSLFGFDEERVAKLANWTTDWPAAAQDWRR